ncbi:MULTISPECIES: hypothetical protein [unclassified Kitasatospora]
MVWLPAADAVGLHLYPALDQAVRPGIVETGGPLLLPAMTGVS